MNLAHQLDPLSLVISEELGSIHYFARQYDEMLAGCKKEGWRWTAYGIAAFYAQMGDREQAFQWLNTAYQQHDSGLIRFENQPFI